MIKFASPDVEKHDGGTDSTLIALSPSNCMVSRSARIHEIKQSHISDRAMDWCIWSTRGKN
jgi:hypothetical protein